MGPYVDWKLTELWNDRLVGVKRREFVRIITALADLMNLGQGSTDYAIGFNPDSLEDLTVESRSHDISTSPLTVKPDFGTSSPNAPRSACERLQGLSITGFSYQRLMLTGIAEELGTRGKLHWSMSDSCTAKDGIPDLPRVGFVKLIELAQQSHAYYQLWITEFHQCCGDSRLRNFSAVTTPFEEGLKALQKCFKDEIPNTLEEIFPLLIISIAACKLEHGVEPMMELKFVTDVYDWLPAISRSEDRKLFFQGVHCMIFPHIRPSEPQWRGIHGHGHGHGHQRSLTQVAQSEKPRMLSAYPSDAVHQAAAPETHSTMISPREEPEDLSLLHRLKKGSVLSVCAHYIDCKW